MVKLLAVLPLLGCAGAIPLGEAGHPVVATFSIVAFDPQTQELGVAVQSKFIAVGSVVPWAKAGVGAVATQSFANTTYGPKGLGLLEQGLTPEETVESLTEEDDRRDLRQVGIVGPTGKSATYTGRKCQAWAGGVAGENFACQGNILAGEGVVAGMAKSFRESKGDLGTRLLEALQAGQDAGGDSRGMQSAALLIVREGWGYGGLNDRYRDLRVDDHPDPIKELKRVYELHREIFPPPSK